MNIQNVCLDFYMKKILHTYLACFDYVSMKSLYVSSLIMLFLIMPCMVYSQRIVSVHKAAKQETIFGIAKDYGVTIDELRNANPAMREPGFMLKKGMMINIPEHKGEPQSPSGYPITTHNSSLNSDLSSNVTKSTTVSSNNQATQSSNAITIGVMLPLHDINGDGHRMTEYYRGMLLAVSDLKSEGYNVVVNAWNVAEGDDIRTTLLDPNASRCDVIFGPLYSSQVRALAEFCMRQNIRLVIPFSITGDDVRSCPKIFQIFQTPADLNAAAIEQFVQRFVVTHPVFIDCNDATSKKGDFTFGLRKRLEQLGVSYNVTNVNNSIESFRQAFASDRINTVILNTGRSPELGQVLRKLDEMVSLEPSLKISMYGYNEWLMYTKVYGEKMRRYDTYIPSTYDYDESSVRIQRIERNYSQHFNGRVQYALPCFALTGYDHVMYFIRGIKAYGRDFVGSSQQKTYTYVQTPLYFDRVGNGGYQNRAFMLVHFK